MNTRIYPEPDADTRAALRRGTRRAAVGRKARESGEVLAAVLSQKPCTLAWLKR